VTASRTGALMVAGVRSRLLDHVLLLGPRHPGLPSAGQMAALAGRGVDALDGYAGRYLPQQIVAAVVPPVVGVRILAADWPSAASPPDRVSGADEGTHGWTFDLLHISDQF